MFPWADTVARRYPPWPSGQSSGSAFSLSSTRAACRRVRSTGSCSTSRWCRHVAQDFEVIPLRSDAAACPHWPSPEARAVKVGPDVRNAIKVLILRARSPRSGVCPRPPSCSAGSGCPGRLSARTDLRQHGPVGGRSASCAAGRRSFQAWRPGGAGPPGVSLVLP